MRLVSDIQRPGNGGVSGSAYWPERTFGDQLPGPFHICADSDFPAPVASLNPALMCTLPVHSLYICDYVASIAQSTGAVKDEAESASIFSMSPFRTELLLDNVIPTTVGGRNLARPK
jgi:hypothetical protein